MNTDYLLVDVINGFNTILHEVQAVSGTRTDYDQVETERILNVIFFQEATATTPHWNFFHNILQRYMERPDSYMSVDYSHQLSCVFAAICLCDPNDFVRFVIGIFSELDNYEVVSLPSLELMLRTVFQSVGGERLVCEALQEIQLYTSSRLDHGEILSLEGEELYPTCAVTQFYIRKHNHALWPLEVVQHQMKKKFLGSDFWDRLRRGKKLISRLDSAYAFCFRDYLETILSLLQEGEEVKKNLTVNNIPEGIEEDIVVDNGVYIYRPRKKTHIRKRPSAGRRPSGTIPALIGVVDSDMSDDVDCRFVSEADVQHRRAMRRSPSSSFQSSSSGSFVSTSPTGSCVDLPSEDNNPYFPITRMRSESIDASLDGHNSLLGGLSDVVSKATSFMKGLRILVIEDSTFQRKMMAKRLKKRRPSGGSLAVSEVNSGTSSPIRRPSGNFGYGGGSLSNSQHGDWSCPSSIDLVEEEIAAEIAAGAWVVSEAGNGEEAIQRLISSKETFDIIFVDENLQSTGGYLLGHEVVKILRGNRSVPNSTIIIGCSANAKKYATSFLEAGADAVWKKPMPGEDMIRSEICKYLAAR
mmetsp:Transcript_7180/g.10678  ORF Transcript_7180/g.10678 Transcript_7180/m.10678 type:complete len:583 (-) Transcript_7180:242-1990(-)